MRIKPTNMVIVPLALAVGGCLPAQEAGFAAPAPNKRLDAIVGAADASDTDTLDGLIGQLESTDPAARVLAIRALELRTGQTLGYAHASPVQERRAAVSRWKTYAAGLGPTEPPTRTPDP